MHIRVCYNPDWLCTLISVLPPPTAPHKPQFCFVLQASLGSFEMGHQKYPLLLLIIIIGPCMPLPSRFISTGRHLPLDPYATPTKLTTPPLQLDKCEQRLRWKDDRKEREGSALSSKAHIP